MTVPLGDRVRIAEGVEANVAVLLDDIDSGGDDLETTARRIDAIREVVARLSDLPAGTTARLWLVTRPSGLFPAPEAAQSPVDAAVWGLGRVVANENPRVTVKRLSFQRGGDAGHDAHRLACELLTDSQESEVVLTRGGRFVPRIVDDSAARRAVPDSTGRFQLDLHDPGSSYRLSWVPRTVPVPGLGEVVIEVRAAGLNYRDIALATGLLPMDAEAPVPGGPALGLECAGDVVAIGPDVAGFRVGDRVFAAATHCLASHVLARTEQLGRIPEGMRYSEAATLPTVFLTVQHSLEHLARLARGETLLVHGAAGGVGLAAVQYAQSLGAAVIATAGTPAKRDLLRMLGVPDVFDSRSLEFPGQVLAATGGRGVDVVLNSLAGEGIARSLECLRPGGRFVELGKRDIYANSPLLMRPFRNNISFFGVDLAQLAVHQPELARAEFEEMASRVTQGRYRPLPHQVYPAARIGEAMRAVQRSRHIGKVVIDFGQAPAVERVPTPPGLDADATYLIAGGVSGLGAATALHLADLGARHLALVSRRGTAAPEAPALMAELAERGVRFHVHAADVTDEQAMRRIVTEARDDGHPVAGVVHAAMHLDDELLSDLSPERIRAVLAPKIRGASVLDAVTRDQGMSLFVLYSSAAALAGNLMQSPYAAANCYMEALVRNRRALELPGLAVAWGRIADTGYVARNNLAASLDWAGVGPVTAAEAFTALDDLLGRGTAVAAAVRVDWARINALLPGLDAPRFGSLISSEQGESRSVRTEEFRAHLALLSPEDAENTVSDTLVGLIASVLQTQPERVDRTAGIDRLGMDSLMAVELLDTVHRRFGCEVPLLEVMSLGSIGDLARRITAGILAGVTTGDRT